METQVQVKTLADPIIVSKQEFHGAEQVGIRFYYTDAGTGELRPGKQGINIPVQFAAQVHAALGAILGITKCQERRTNAKKAARTQKAIRTQKH